MNFSLSLWLTHVRRLRSFVRLAESAREREKKKISRSREEVSLIKAKAKNKRERGTTMKGFVSHEQHSRNARASEAEVKFKPQV
jgi:hypothetical protein